MAEHLFILRHADNESATRCFQFAKVAREKGHAVNIFLVDGGVDWARPDKDLSQKTVTGDAPEDYLPYLVENEVPIGV
jgi:sulfur relay (sulfurtransferase) complex TusBCD TusD component (DsrE family)